MAVFLCTALPISAFAGAADAKVAAEPSSANVRLEASIIHYDAFHHMVTGPDRLSVKSGSLVRLRVHNINPFLYRVEVSGKSIRRFTEYDKAFTEAIGILASGETSNRSDKPTPETMATDPAALFRASIANLERIKVLPMRLRVLMESEAVEPRELKRAAFGLAKQCRLECPEEHCVPGEVRIRVVTLLRDAEKYAGAPDHAHLKVELEHVKRGASEYFASADLAEDRLARIETASYEVVSAPVQALDHAVQFSLKIIPNDGTASRTASRALDAPAFLVLETRGGFHVDVSGGFFISRLGDYQYSVEGGQIKEREAFNSHWLAGGPLLLAHLNYQLSCPMEMHLLSIGVGLGQGKNANYLIGVGVGIGRRRRLVLTGGYMLGRSSGLGGGLSVGSVFNGAYDSIPRENRYRTAPFLSASFNF